ncbi:MAG TPA: DMT family transporter, partial [Bacteroidales bacterium]|nr:DMT family transporter [Bacteroidales bacterium]
MNNTNRSHTALSWLIFVIIAFTWGSSFILIKKGLVVFSPNEVGALRIALSFLFLLPFALVRVRKIPLSKLLILLLSGIIGNGIPAFLFAKAQTVIDSSVAGILNSLTPLLTVLVGTIAFKLRLSWSNVFGVAMGFAGAVGLLVASGGNNLVLHLEYALYIIAATLLYAVNVNLIKSCLSDVDPVGIVAVSFMLMGFPVLIYLLFFTGFPVQLVTHPGAVEGLAYITILAIGGSALALILFNRLLKATDPIFASSVTYLMPL